MCLKWVSAPFGRKIIFKLKNKKQMYFILIIIIIIITIDYIIIIWVKEIVDRQLWGQGWSVGAALLSIIFKM